MRGKTDLVLRVLVAGVGAHVEAGRVHGSRGARHVSAHVRQVALGGRLHLAELATEGHDCPSCKRQNRTESVVCVYMYIGLVLTYKKADQPPAYV